MNGKSHPCACHFNKDKAGHACGLRSAHDRPNGAEPVCLVTEVTPELLADPAWRYFGVRSRRLTEGGMPNNFLTAAKDGAVDIIKEHAKLVIGGVVTFLGLVAVDVFQGVTGAKVPQSAEEWLAFLAHAPLPWFTWLGAHPFI